MTTGMRWVVVALALSLFAAPVRAFSDAQVREFEAVLEADGVAPASERAPSLRFALAALLALGLAWLARRQARERARESGFGVGAASPVRPLLATLLAGGSVLLSATQLALSLALLVSVPLALAPPRESARRPPLGHFEPLGRATLEALARRARTCTRGRLTRLDASTSLGALGLMLVVLGVLALPRAFELDAPYGLALLCAVPCWFAGSRLRAPRPLEERARLLAEVARASRLRGCAMRLVGYVSDDAELRELRLRVVPAQRCPGLVRLELLVDTRRAAPPLWLSAVVQADSPCVAWLAEALPGARRERSTAGSRLAFVQPLEDDFDARVCALLALWSRKPRAEDGSLSPLPPRRLGERHPRGHEQQHE